ncbi:hypothetical protein CK203_008555 [Vitis vinifera]|uniref:Uncharacterized protein n=1 Tax=Vitis vinifera TaxID=29760 RepID=A0A438KDN6_VITVI|nr:hypothetical protein CK203_008555 [Vitis vinifera]
MERKRENGVLVLKGRLWSGIWKAIRNGLMEFSKREAFKFCGPKQSLARKVKLEICNKRGVSLETNYHQEVWSRGWGVVFERREGYGVGLTKMIGYQKLGRRVRIWVVGVHAFQDILMIGINKDGWCQKLGRRVGIWVVGVPSFQDILTIGVGGGGGFVSQTTTLGFNKDGWVLEAWEEGGDLGSWSPCSSRHLND